MTANRPEALQAWNAMCEAVDSVRLALNRELQRDAGLTLADNLVLCHVAMAPGKRLRMVDIADLLTIGKSAVTKTVDRLEGRGLLTRRNDPADRRTVYATLTTRGEKMFAAAQPLYVDAVQRHFGNRLNRNQIRQVQQLSELVAQRTHRSHNATAPA